MKKYILCILLGAVLLMGINYIFHDELQQSQIEAGVGEDVQCHFESDCCVSTSIGVSRGEGIFTSTDKASACEVGNGMIGLSYLAGNTVPLKILKYSANDVIKQLLRILENQLTDKKRRSLLLDTNLAKSSYRYYVYTLKHILI